MNAKGTAKIENADIRNFGQAQQLPKVKMNRFVAFALLLALNFLGLGSLCAQTPGPILYNKPNGLGDLDLWSVQPNGTGNAVVKITYDPGICDRCPLLGAQHPAWSRNGQMIAVTGLIAGQGFQNLAGGYAMVVFQASNPLGTLKALAPLGTAIGGGPAAFSPDGTQLAFTDVGPGFQTYRVININGSNLRDITFPLGEQVPFPGLDWSPTNANTLVVSRVDPSLSNVQGNTQLVLVPPTQDGILEARPLTRPPYSLEYIFSDISPAFSPSGRFVAFSRLVQNILTGVSSTEIRVIDITNPGDLEGQRLTSIPVGCYLGNLSWSGDGSKLVLGCQTQFEDYGLWIYNGSTVTKLEQPPALNPAWDPIAR